MFNGLFENMPVIFDAEECHFTLGHMRYKQNGFGFSKACKSDSSLQSSVSAHVLTSSHISGWG